MTDPWSHRLDPATRGTIAKQLLPDMVAVLLGIVGSALRKDYRDPWALSGQAVWWGLRTLGGCTTK
ncbi:MAG TPA: hypothetical protein VGJ59_24055 [Jatrophihabitantaceae bacterium]